jgi:predicted transcriptional regulator
MKIETIVKLLDAKVLCGEDKLDEDVFSACGSDMMSDVLAYVKDQAVLLTGLVNPQVIRTAEMMDMKCIVFVRSKVPSDDMVELADDMGLVILTTAQRLYEACGKLYVNGLRGNGSKK